MKIFFKDVHVAHIIDSHQLVLNVGSEDGVDLGIRFLIYGLSEDDIIDPVTSKPLGRLELVRGTGSVTYVQDKMSIITSDTPANLGFISALNNEYAPFKSPCVGDYARQI